MKNKNYILSFNNFSILEDADANASNTVGAGVMMNSQPSALPGQTSEPGFTANGGVVGSGDIDVPYCKTRGKNPFIYQQIPAKTVFNKKRSDKKTSKDIIQKLYQQKQDYTENQGNVLHFDDFVKTSLNQVTHNSK